MASDAIKSYVVNQGQLPNQQVDPQLDAVLQSILIDDADLKRILKGEIHDKINTLNQMMVYFQQRGGMLLDYFNTNNQKDNAVILTQIQLQIKEIEKQLGTIQLELRKYRRYVPYLMLFTPTSVLSNITEKEAKMLFRKVDIMVTRDELDCQEDDDVLEDKNFFDSVRIAFYLHVMRNVEGHTFKGLVEERRSVTNLIQDNTNKGRKKILGIF